MARTTNGTATSAWPSGIMTIDPRRSNGGVSNVISNPNPIVTADVPSGSMRPTSRRRPLWPPAAIASAGEPADDDRDDGGGDGEAHEVPSVARGPSAIAVQAPNPHRPGAGSSERITSSDRGAIATTAVPPATAATPTRAARVRAGALWRRRPSATTPRRAVEHEPTTSSGRPHRSVGRTRARMPCAGPGAARCAARPRPPTSGGSARRAPG